MQILQFLILDREVQALTLRNAIRGKNENLFNVTMTVTAFGENKEKLDDDIGHS